MIRKQILSARERPPSKKKTETSQPKTLETYYKKEKKNKSKFKISKTFSK